MTDTAAQLLARVDTALAGEDHTTALQLLKDGAERFPEDAELAYRMGAEHAYVDLFDVAEAEMARALTLDPDHMVAHFHLGLLQITRSRYEEAMATWRALDTLPEDHALRLYKRAFEILAEDRFAPARAFIERGLAAAGSTEALDGEMRRLLDSLPAAS